MTKELAFRLISRIPLCFLRKVAGANPTVPYYHMVSDERVVHVEHLYRYKNSREFRVDLDLLLRKYIPMDLREILERLKRGQVLPGNALLLTFDDGYREMSDVVAPILLQKGISATFFVNSGFIDNTQLCYLNKASLLVERFRSTSSSAKRVLAILRSNNIQISTAEASILGIKYEERDVLDEIGEAMDVDFEEYLVRNKPYLTTEQIIKLIESGFTIGAHSIDHPLYASLPLEEQIHQTIQSVEFVRERFNLGYGVFAFPHSDEDVTQEFFQKLSESGLVDLSFGTAGFMDDCVPQHVQRLSLEKPVDRADRIIAFHHARRLKKLLTKRSRIVRA